MSGAPSVCISPVTQRQLQASKGTGFISQGKKKKKAARIFSAPAPILRPLHLSVEIPARHRGEGTNKYREKLWTFCLYTIGSSAAVWMGREKNCPNKTGLRWQHRDLLIFC